MKRMILDMALSLGFSKIGFAKAEPLKEDFSRFKQWLNSGYHADMKWIEKVTEKRYDPGNILPGAKTIIVTATNYFTDHYYPDKAETGKISRYAWGYDYHDIILKKLNNLCDEIKEKFPCAVTHPYVDTGPVLERAWAQKAGVGWIGKSGMLITREFGSWVFLGVVITDLEIEPDHPLKNLCGKCTDCLDSCPTGAIDSPGMVDSNLCISYHTIESRAETFPLQISKNLNGWIYGCDICQEVCPWNRKFAENSSIKEFNPRMNETVLELKNILTLDQEQFLKRFVKSPVKRAKLNGLKRNANELLGKRK